MREQSELERREMHRFTEIAFSWEDHPEATQEEFIEELQGMVTGPPLKILNLVGQIKRSIEFERIDPEIPFRD